MSYDYTADEMARRHARRALKTPTRFLVTISPKRAEAEISELDRRAKRPVGTPRRVPLDPAQMRRLFPDD